MDRACGVRGIASVEAAVYRSPFDPSLFPVDAAEPRHSAKEYLHSTRTYTGDTYVAI